MATGFVLDLDGLAVYAVLSLRTDPSAESRLMVGRRQMRFMFATEVAADPVGQFLSGEQTGRLDNVPFAVDPVRLNRVEPGTLGGQTTGDESHALSKRTCGGARRASAVSAPPRHAG